MKSLKIITTTTLFATLFLLSACGNSQPTTQVSETKTQVSATPTAISKAAVDTEKFNAYVKNIKGASFLKTSVIANSNEANLEYYDSYDNYKAAKPDSKISKEDFNNYWSTGDAINKALMEEPLRLLREFPELQNVSMILPFQGKHYFTNVDRSTVEEYLKFKLASLDKDAWIEKVSNKFFTKEERSKYIAKFVKVS